MMRFKSMLLCVILLLSFVYAVTFSQTQVFYTTNVPIPSLNTWSDNGGIGWGDVNGDGYLDLYIPSNNILLNNGTSLAVAASTLTANIPVTGSSTAGLLADFNGNGNADLLTTNNGKPLLFVDEGGVYINVDNNPALSGDLATAGKIVMTFGGITAADINHDNYLDIAWAGGDPSGNYPGDGAIFPPGYGIWMLKGGPTGFVNVGRNATPENRAIDQSLSFEAWNPIFFDATNDGYPDLFMPSFRHNGSIVAANAVPPYRLDSAHYGARKGCVLFINDGTGKFIVPTAASLGRTIYSIDSISRNGKIWASQVPDTGIIVDDTVRHFSAIGNTFGDLNNDGFQDLLLVGLTGHNLDGDGALKNVVILYGKGDGTFTYKWDGVNFVPHGLPQLNNIRAYDVGDYNNDGIPDLVGDYLWNNSRLYKGNGNGTYTEVTSDVGLTGGGRRSNCFVDFNKDGFLDIYSYTGANGAYLRQATKNSNNWVAFQPVGKGMNKGAIGAMFTLYTNGGTKKQIREIFAGGGAGNGPRPYANFGLGTLTSFDSIVVRWPDGEVQRWSFAQLSAGGAINPINRYWVIQQGAIVPEKPTLLRPSWAQLDTGLIANVNLVWSKVQGGTGNVSYQVQVSTSRTFSTILKDVTLADTTTSVRLGLSTKYYWRARAFSAGFTSAWSNIDSFATKIVVCTTVPRQLNPVTNSTVEPIKPTLKVSYVAEASTYHIQVTDSVIKIKNINGQDSIVTFAGLPASRFVLNDSVNILDTAYRFASNLVPAKKYYWRVRGWNAAGSSAWSSIDSFTIMYLPVAPRLAYPTTNQANLPVNITFKWYSVRGDSSYILEYWTYTSAGEKKFTIITGAHDTTAKVGDLMNRSRYYWRVKAANQAGEGPFSVIDSFTVSIEPPVAPRIVSPRNVTGVPRLPKLVWTQSLYATHYHVQIARDNGFSTMVLDSITAVLYDTVLYVKDTLLANTTYYWRVAARNEGGEGPFTGGVYFSTGTVVSVEEEELLSQIPEEFALLQNYPNPFNPATTIRYDVPVMSHVTLTVYDMLGRVVATLVNEIQPARSYSVQWNASNLSSGMYVYRITAKSLDGSKTFTAVKKLMLVK